MLDRKLIRQEPERVQRAIDAKGIELRVDDILATDARVRDLQYRVDQTQAERKSLSKEFAKADEQARAALREKSEQASEQLTSLRAELGQARDELNSLMLQTPQIPWEGAPIGADESDNVVIKTVGTPPEFDFTPLDHVALAEERGWAEFARARNVSGERAYALRGDLVLLERAIHSHALQLLVSKGFTPIGVPTLVKEHALVGTGMFPKGREEIYELPADNLFLAGTSEVGMVGLHADEILDAKQLPVTYAGISPCFRREIGSASRDVRGMLRVHQFEKVEQFVICEADEETSASWHAALLDTAEQILQDLGLSYEVVECCTGDMGQGKFRMNDINTWFPSLGLFRETHSCSTLHDWQARRANIRYRDKDGAVQFAHTLNNTAVATPRLLAALIENFQTAERQVRVPELLQPYLGGRELL